MSALNTGDKLFFTGVTLGVGAIGGGISQYLAGTFNWASFGTTALTVSAGFLIGGWVLGALANQITERNGAGGWAGVFVGFAALVGALGGSVGGYFVADKYVEPAVMAKLNERASIATADILVPQIHSLPKLTV